MDHFMPDSDEDEDISDLEISRSNKDVDFENIEEDDESSDDAYCPEDAESVIIPEKSKPVYDKHYKNFKDLMKARKITIINEGVMLGYFNMLKKGLNDDDDSQTGKTAKRKIGMAPNSLWAVFSMLKRTLLVYDRIDISKFRKLVSFLTLNAKNCQHVSKKAKTFTDEQIAKFLDEAPDNDYLAIKVALILGIHGRYRRNQLHNLVPENLQDHGTCITFEMDKLKNGANRPTAITGHSCHLVQKYMALRPADFTAKPNFFLRYERGKCHRAVMGIHTIGRFPKEIAFYLGLPNPELYTGHSFRRTGTTRAVESSLDHLQLKKLGGDKSSVVAESLHDSSRTELSKVPPKISNLELAKMAASSTITKPPSPLAPDSPEYECPSTSNQPEVAQVPRNPISAKFKRVLSSNPSTSEQPGVVDQVPRNPTAAKFKRFRLSTVTRLDPVLVTTASEPVQTHHSTVEEDEVPSPSRTPHGENEQNDYLSQFISFLENR